MKYIWHMQNRFKGQVTAIFSILQFFKKNKMPPFEGFLFMLVLLTWAILLPFSPLIAILRFPIDSLRITRQIKEVEEMVEQFTDPREITETQKHITKDIEELRLKRDTYTAERMATLLPFLERQLTIVMVGFKTENQ